MIQLIPTRKEIDNFDLTHYKNNEDCNEHLLNYNILAHKFAPYYILCQVFDTVSKINFQGYTAPAQSRWLYDNLNQYYSKLN